MGGTQSGPAVQPTSQERARLLLPDLSYYPNSLRNDSLSEGNYTGSWGYGCESPSYNNAPMDKTMSSINISSVHFRLFLAYHKCACSINHNRTPILPDIPKEDRQQSAHPPYENTIIFILIKVSYILLRAGWESDMNQEFWLDQSSTFQILVTQSS